MINSIYGTVQHAWYKVGIVDDYDKEEDNKDESSSHFRLFISTR